MSDEQGVEAAAVAASMEAAEEPSMPDLADSPSEERFIGVIPSAPPIAWSETKVGKIVVGGLDWLGGIFSSFLGPPGRIGYGGAQAGAKGLGGKSLGTLAVNLAEEIFGTPSKPSEAQIEGPTETPSVPSTDFDLNELLGFPSAEGGGEYPIAPIGAIPLSTPSYVKPALVQKEVAALAKYLSFPTQQNLSDVLTQARSAYSSDFAKEEAQKEAESTQSASILPIMGIILIGALIAFKKEAMA